KATGWAYSRIFNQITSNPAGNDFSVSTNPTSGSVTAGGSTTTTVTTAVTSGSAQPVTLSTAGAPAAVTVSFNPRSVTAGGSSTLTLTSASSTAVGSYPITVTGSAASGTHSTTYTLTVNPPSSGDAIVNGGFETGDFTGWTRSGTTSIVSGPVHSGTHAVLLGSANPTNGDSKVNQTFTAPTGATRLSFWYNVNCPDDVLYASATA